MIADIHCDFEPKLIIVETDKNPPFAIVKLMVPILRLVRIADFDETFAVAMKMDGGLHHTETGIRKI